MSLFGSIGSFLGGAVNTVVKTVTQPKKLATAIVTGGLSVVAPKVTKPLEGAVGTLYNPNLIKPLVGVATKNPALLAGSLNLQGGSKMGLDLGGILGTVSNIFGGNQNPIFQGVSNVAGLTQSFLPTAQPVAARMPAIANQALRNVPMIGRSFFNKYPNLATAIQQFRNMGRKVTRAQLWSLLKRFGPELLVSGGILTAAAVNELMIAGPGRRRMNPANVRALRRGIRRLKSFERLASTVSQTVGRAARTGGRRRLRGPSRRCGTCRSNPCAC